MERHEYKMSLRYMELLWLIYIVLAIIFILLGITQDPIAGIGLVLIFFATGVSILTFISRKIILNNNGVEIHDGILSFRSHQIPYEKINSVTVYKNIVGKYFNFGDILITTGNDTGSLIFHAMDKPEHLKEILDQRLSKKIN